MKPQLFGFVMISGKFSKKDPNLMGGMSVKKASSFGTNPF